MFTKICMAAAIALGCTLVAPGSSFAAADKDKTATTQHKKVKKGHSNTVHENASYDSRKKGFSDTAHENASYDRPKK